MEGVRCLPFDEIDGHFLSLSYMKELLHFADEERMTHCLGKVRTWYNTHGRRLLNLEGALSVGYNFDVLFHLSHAFFEYTHLLDETFLVDAQARMISMLNEQFIDHERFLTSIPNPSQQDLHHAITFRTRVQEELARAKTLI
jgi:hypothetical protein